MGFNQRITRIKDLSDRRRLPRLGIVRLGIKQKSQKTGNEYPTETPFFVCPPEVQAIYGDKPTELDVMLPLNELDAVFPCAYKFYGSGKGLKCSGDGEIAYRVNDQTKEMEQIDCPCDLLDSGKCKQSGTLMVILPKVSVGGIYQIRTSSYNSIVDVNSGLDYVSALLGRFSLVPLKLRRVKTETHHDEKKQNHYTLQIIFDADITTLNALRQDSLRILEQPRYQLPAPIDDNPELDPPDEIIDEEDISDSFTKDEQTEKTQEEKNRSRLEIMLADAKIDRDNFKEWLISEAWLPIPEGDKKPSMKDVNDKNIKYLIDKFSSAQKMYGIWLNKQGT